MSATRLPQQLLENAARLILAERAPLPNSNRAIAPPIEEGTDETEAGVVPTPELDAAAYDGPLGELVRAIEPHTEAHPAAILFSALAMYGSMVGPAPIQLLDGRIHRANLFVFITGDTSTGRKGTAYNRARQQMHEIDPTFAREHIVGGLSTGEGLIHRVRDAAVATEGEGDAKIVDVGVADKRLLVSEEEIGVAFRRASNRENTLLLVLRQAWDGASLSTLTRKGSMTATDPHISIIGQITGAELSHLATDADFQGGTLNRFLFCHTERVRLLPDGGDPDFRLVEPIRQQLREALRFARDVQQITLGPLARVWWRKNYEALTTGAPGRYGQATRRGAPIVRRVAAIYALSQGRAEVNARDLSAALAVWNYSCASAARVFGRATLSARAERLLSAIEDAGVDGASRAVLRAAAGSNNLAAREITTALIELRDAGLARVEHVKTDGRPIELWRSTSFALSMGRMGGMGDKPLGTASIPPIPPIPPSEKQGVGVPTPKSRLLI